MDGCSPRADDLGPGPGPARLLAALAGEPGLACLWGDWAGQRAVLIMSRPLATSTDPAVLDDQPAVTGAAPVGVVGGGWVGWLGYDAPHHLAYYDHLLRWDPGSGRWSFEALWSPARNSELTRRRERFRALLAAPLAAPSVDPGLAAVIGEFSGPEHAVHLAAVEHAIGLIRDGEIYQVNVCTRLVAGFDGDPVGLFARAVAELQPAFGALVSSPHRTVLSFSPELFLRRRGDQVRTAPIKGTWARDAGDDGAHRLRGSTKDVAENVMIVDLMRNDLGRMARPGSVHARQLLRVEPHPGVWHLVSGVEATRRVGVGDAELLAATFPPGSVTGVPKLRAVAAIEELEDQPRRVYTGAIGIAGPTVGLTLSVAIRTFELAGGRLELGVGGGVTVDSVPELEWRECAQKAAPLLAALGARAVPEFRARMLAPLPWQRAGGLIETILAVEGNVRHLGDHLARLARSCAELYGGGLPAELASQVGAALAGCLGRTAIRVVVSPALDVSIRAAPAAPPPAASEVRLTHRPAGVWRHKWADRSWIEAGESAARLPLYVAGDGCLLETSRGNLFVLRADGALMTPPLRDDLLPGITRQAILDRARAQGRPVEVREFGRAELLGAAGAWWTSSLSGSVPITAVDGVALPVASGPLPATAAALPVAPAAPLVAPARIVN